jgi:4a-hydroxytetrahydrobiopterin dehydratase
MLPVTVDERTASEIDRLLLELAGWEPDAACGGIRKSYRFASFAEAFTFKTRAALLAEKADHHPERFNVYGRVDILLTTQDVGGVTIRDLDLARAIDGYAVGVNIAQGVPPC